MATQAKKSTKAKAEKAPKAPKAEKVLGYFRPGTAVGVIAAYVADEKPHKIDSVLAHAQKEGKLTEDQAAFAFRVLFISPYKENGGSVGKIAAKKLGGAIVNFQENTVQFLKSKRVTEIMAAKVEKKPGPKTRTDANTKDQQTKSEPVN